MEKQSNIIRTYTDLRQAEKILEIGIIGSTADMCYIDSGQGYQPTLYQYHKVKKMFEQGLVNCIAIFPCWSIMSLLHLCPEGHIEIDTRDVTSYLSDDGSCDYYDKHDNIIDNLIDCIDDLIGNDLIDAIYWNRHGISL